MVDLPDNKSLTGANEDGNSGVLYVYKRLYPYIKPFLFRAIVSMAITIPIGALDAAVALSLKPFMDGMQIKHSIDHLSYIPLLIVGLTVVQGILNYFSIYLNGWLGFHITNNIRYDLYKKLLARDIQFFDKTPSGLIIQRYFRDPEALQTNILENVKLTLTRFFSSIALICALVYTSWQLSIVAVVVLLCILYPSTRIRQIIKDMARELTKTGGLAMSIYTETAGGIKIIHSYNLFQEQLKKLKVVQRSMLDRTMKKTKAQGWMTPSMHVIASVGIALIIWQGSQMVLAGQLTTGGLVSFLAALIMLYNPIKNLGGSLMNAQMSMLAAGRVFNLMDQCSSIQDSPQAVSLSKIHKGIEFDNVTFYYASGKGPVLKNFNLSIRAGETVALVGNSGSGKTTIANLIPRFYDVNKGAIRIDGVDIRDMRLESLRQHIAIVMQDNFLFDGTIRENITIGNLKANEEELYDAIDKAYLTDFLKSLNPKHSIEKALENHIGERGIMLSGGQRQRIAIARALLKKAPIIILDEATSALDNQSEAIVQKAIDSLMLDRTVIVIAHRLSTIRNVDRIVVLDKGQVIEQGTHQDLLDQDGFYAKLYRIQFGSLEDKQALITKDAELTRTLL